MSIIKVSARSRTASVAGAIAGVIREANRAEVQAIGAGAVNQAVKAIIIASGYLAEEDRYVACLPSFVEVMIDDQERTAIRFVVEAREQLVEEPLDLWSTV
ncbi:MAG: stage V sporulation protein S [Chloroflexota bacterium]